VAEDAPAVSEGSSIAAFGVRRFWRRAEEIDVYVSQRGAMNAGGDEHSIAIRPGFSAVKAVRKAGSS
jgi:iron complex transport system substrate-binding protein